MAQRIFACALALACASGCTRPFHADRGLPASFARSLPARAVAPTRSVYRPGDDQPAVVPVPAVGATADDFVRYAIDHSPKVESAYQRWVAAAERLPQVKALPDPRISLGFFLDEVETRVGPQQARVGVSQMFPWPGLLEAREDAAAQAARAAWRRLEASVLEVTENVISTLHELAYLDAAIRITRENLELLASFEEVVRARYRVGAGSHPELVRVQVELGQLEDRLRQLHAMRPTYVAELNAAMNRPLDTAVNVVTGLPRLVATASVTELVAMASEANPMLLALDDQIEEQRLRVEVAKKEGLPEFTVGLDYIFTGNAMNPSIAESGDDPILLNFGVTVPLWRSKYNAGVREAMARRLAVLHERADETNRLAVLVQRAWFEHTDADRRVRLFETTLIPKAKESLQASMASFRAGETTLLELLDTERTLLEFAISAERARANRAQALARLDRLVGRRVPARDAALAVESNPSNGDDSMELKP